MREQATQHDTHLFLSNLQILLLKLAAFILNLTTSETAKLMILSV